MAKRTVKITICATRNTPRQIMDVKLYGNYDLTRTYLLQRLGRCNLPQGVGRTLKRQF